MLNLFTHCYIYVHVIIQWLGTGQHHYPVYRYMHVVAPGHKEHEEPLAVSIPSHHWVENYSSLGSKFRSRLGGVTSSQDAA